METVVRPLTPERWDDVEAIFNAKGCAVARGCWCMHYRHSGRQPRPPPGATWRDANRAGLKALTEAAAQPEGGPPPGLVGYRGDTPAGWVSLGPRQDFAKLRRSPVMKPVDEEPVWSVVCFVVPAAWRGQGVAKDMLQGAIDYARRQGATVLEAYPVDKAERSRDDSMWFGAKSMYDAAGFVEAARRKPTRPVLRLRLG